MNIKQSICSLSSKPALNSDMTRLYFPTIIIIILFLHASVFASLWSSNKIYLYMLCTFFWLLHVISFALDRVKFCFVEWCA